MGKFTEKHKVKLGFAPTRRQVFSKEEAGRFKNIIEEKVKSYGIDYVNLDFLNSEGLLYNGLDSDKVAKKFIEEGVDAIFVPHCNFGTEDAVAKLAKKVNKPVLVWGPQDDAPLPDGRRMRDTQCGLFATTKVLSRFGVPFTYITNSYIEDEVFDRGFRNFIAASAVVKAFKKLRIGQIDTRPGAFWSVMCNEAELLERFGVEVVPLSLVDIEKEVLGILSENGTELKETVSEIMGRVRNINIGEEALTKLAALKLAIKKWAEVQELSAVCIQCWHALQKSLGIACCFVDAELTDEGLPTVCETDIHGAITAVLTQAAGLGETSVFFADLTVRHPENKNAELLWHCGTFPHSLAKDANGVNIGCNGRGFPGVGNWEIKGGDITVSRFDGLNGEYFFLMGHGKGVEGPKNTGTYLWTEFNNWPKWEHKFIYGPYIHHCVGIHGKLAPVLYEACKYIPGLNADSVDPTKDEIEEYLRG